MMPIEDIDGNSIIEVDNINKIYNIGEAETIALNNVSLTVMKGSFVSIIGPSGSGKSTLIHLLAGLDHPSQNKDQKLEVLGKSLLGKSENYLAKFRSEHVGFILQFFGLLPTLTVLENVMIAGYFSKMAPKVRFKKSKEILLEIGLGDRLNHYPNQLSGGQMQRVAIARALVNEPELIFADEPTGNLDSKNGEEILKLLYKIAKEQNRTVIVVTHDPSVVIYSDQIIEIIDGKITRNEIINENKQIK